MFAHKSDRNGKIIHVVIVFLLLGAVGAGVGFYAWANLGGGKTEQVITIKAKRAPFIHEITAKGTLISASNVDVRCEVETSGGAMILWLIEEGSHVEEGDILCELDSAKLEEDLIQQQIVCNGSKAQVIQAQATYDTAILAKKEYEEGTYVQERLTILNKKATAEQDEKRATDTLAHTQRLFARGYVTQMQVDADAFAVEKAVREREIAEKELLVLDEFTKKKKLTELDSNIETAKAKLESEQHSHQLDLERLEYIKEQIEKCTVRAPTAGEVVYWKETNRWRSSSVTIEEGATIHQRAIMFQLPDYSQMQVKCTVNETHVALVESNMPAHIEIDAVPGKVFTGEVVTVNEYPEQASHFGGAAVKEYATTISIDEANKAMRPGLSANAQIQVNSMDSVLQVPVQCVFEHGDKMYCIAYDAEPDKWQAVEVEIGPTNDKQIVVLSGIDEGQLLVEGAGRFRDRVELPKIDENAKAPLRARTPLKAEAEDDKSTGGKSGPGESSPNQMFATLDKNKDGKLQKDELPPPMQAKLSDIDTNGDGEVSQSELEAAAAKMGGGRGTPSGGAGGGPGSAGGAPRNGGGGGMPGSGGGGGPRGGGPGAGGGR